MPAAERKLTNRKRRANKGRIIRVSRTVFEVLDQQRRRGRNTAKLLSWDCFMRRTYGLPDRRGTEQPLIEGMLDATSGLFLLKLPETPWAELEETAFRLAEITARKTKQRAAQRPIKMREVR